MNLRTLSSKQRKLTQIRSMELTRCEISAHLFSALFLLTAIGFISTEKAWAQSATRNNSRAQFQEANKSKSAERNTEPTKFLRVVNDDRNTPRSLQTAITRYRPDKGEVVVDLVGAVHIGEGNYYRQLNRQFELYDTVLYELVAPQGTRIPRGGKKKSDGLPTSPMDLVGWMQGQAQTQLGLESQLAMIDYQKSNFTHADLSPTQMAEKMAERGDTPLTVGLSALTEMMRQQNKAAQQAKNGTSRAANRYANENLFGLLGDPLKMKRMMALQFTNSGVMDAGLGKTMNQLLITDRNEAAMSVLQKELAKGNKKIAIFYGAAHMPDFEERLVKKFALKKTKQVWVEAWDLTKAGTKRSGNGTSDMLMNLLNELTR